MPFPLLDGLPDAELQALRLDGESFPLHGAHLSVSTPECPEARAAAALLGLPDRVIAAGWTAAWVWGAAPLPPASPEYLADIDARWRPRPGRVHVAEAVVRAGDVVALGAARVTSPLRTALDLARFTDHDPGDAVLAALGECGGFTRVQAIDALDRGANLPFKRRAAARLGRALRARISPT